MAIYQIAVSGVTFSGSTSFFNANTAYTPVANVNQPGFLAVAGGAYDTTGVTGNGINISDIGLLVGTPFDLDVRAGETIWGSNTAILDTFLSQPSRTGRAALDEATQTFDPATGVLRTVIDPNVAQQTTLDFFVGRDGILATPRNIVAGEVILDFAPDFSSVVGVATFFGVGIIEPGTFAESLQFQGVFVG
jgi:hypothetical protein